MKEIMVKIPANPENTVSRGQAKRFIKQNNLDEYEQIELNFEDAHEVGKAFLKYLLVDYGRMRPEVTVMVCGMDEELFKKVKEMNQSDWESE